MISLYLVIYDVIAVNAAYFLGLWFRFDCTYSAIPGEYLSAYLKFTPWYMVFSVFVFWILRLYNSVWRFASYSELIRVGISTVITFDTGIIKSLCDMKWRLGGKRKNV